MRAFLLLVLTLIGPLSCTSASPPHASTGAASAYRPSAPARPGGTLAIADFEYPQTLAPATARTDQELRLGGLLFSPLWGLDPRGRPYPDLARQVPTPRNGGVRASADGRSMTVDVQLVPGLRWSDGQPITADDVIFTWRALSDPATEATAPPGLERITGMERRSGTEVRWTVDGLDAGYLALGAALYVLPAHRLAALAHAGWASDDFFERPDVVSGPFTVAGAVPDDHVVFAANPQYTNGRAAQGAYPDGGAPFTHAPHLQRVVFQAQAAKETELQALLAQGVDVGFHLLPDDLAALRAAAGSAPVVTTGLRHELLNPNHGTNRATGEAPPWVGDARVLEALDAALDREALVRDLLSGAGRPARGLYPRALAGFASGSTLPSEADPARARRLLDAAGWAPGPDGVRARGGRRLAFVLTGICGRAGLERELDRLRREWQAVGAAVTTGCQDRDPFLRQNAEGAFDMTVYSEQRAPDPGAWAPAGVTGRPDNWNRCEDRALDAAFARLATLDAGARRAAARDVEREWLRYRCTIPLLEWPDVRQVSTRMRNFAPNPAAPDTWNAGDWWLAPS